MKLTITFIVLVPFICVVRADFMKGCECIGFEYDNGPKEPTWKLPKSLQLIGSKLKCDSEDKKKCKDYCFEFYRNVTNNFDLNQPPNIPQNHNTSLGQYLCNMLKKPFEGYLHLGTTITCVDKKSRESVAHFDLMPNTRHPLGFKVRCVVEYRFDPNTV